MRWVTWQALSGRPYGTVTNVQPPVPDGCVLPPPGPAPGGVVQALGLG